MTDELTVDRRTYLATTGAAAVGATALAGCLGGGTGTLATQVTDQPGDIDDFESCIVTIVGMWLGPEDAETPAGNATDGGSSADREYYEYDEPQEADLVDLQDSSTQLVDERELDTSSYSYLQLDIEGVDATLTNGDSAQVDVPGEAPLTFNSSFEIRADTRTVFTADFTPVQRSQGGGYLIRPVPDGITVEYEQDTATSN
ncbi:DUF4382 domain-containing protein [Halolamina sp. C58]|uniref:DUF4382 domain-containing protein n=1 Tax=Halolamina sp. C58 TaxID=3421640 RepID=UPI003EBB2010